MHISIIVEKRAMWLVEWVAILLFLGTYPSANGQSLGDVKWRCSDKMNRSSGAFPKDALNEKIVVLSFWSMRCSPCLQMLPKINRIAEDYLARNVVFLWLNTHDEPHKAIDSIAKIHSNITIVYDSMRTTWKKYGEPPWGRLLIFNRSGEVAWKGETHEFNRDIIDKIVRYDKVVPRERFFIKMNIERVVELSETKWSFDQSEKELKILLQNMDARDLLQKLYKLAYGSDDIVVFENVPETVMLYNAEISTSSAKLLSESLKQAVAQMAGFFNVAIQRSMSNGRNKALFDFKEFLELKE